MRLKGAGDGGGGVSEKRHPLSIYNQYICIYIITQIASCDLWTDPNFYVSDVSSALSTKVLLYFKSVEI